MRERADPFNIAPRPTAPPESAAWEHPEGKPLKLGDDQGALAKAMTAESGVRAMSVRIIRKKHRDYRGGHLMVSRCGRADYLPAESGPNPDHR